MTHSVGEMARGERWEGEEQCLFSYFGWKNHLNHNIIPTDGSTSSEEGREEGRERRRKREGGRKEKERRD